LLAARERPTLLRGALGQAREEREHALEIGPDGRAVFAREGPELEILQHGHPREDPASLRRLGDAEPHDAVGRERVETLAAEGDAAAARTGGAQDGPQ